MPRIYDALEELLDRHWQEEPRWTGTVHDLHAELRQMDPTVDASVGDIDEALRDLHRGGRLRLQAPWGWEGELEIRPTLAPKETRMKTQNISVNGGHVQIGDHNQQAITYGNVLQTLIENIGADETMPTEEKQEHITALQKLLAHPLTQTAITIAASQVLK